jgi:hypothetical protein
MDEKELERRASQIHNERLTAQKPQSPLRENTYNASKWLQEVAKPALDVLAVMLKDAGRSVQPSVTYNPVRKWQTLRLMYPNHATFTYSVGLRVSAEGIKPDIRVNHKPFKDIPDRRVLDWTQDGIHTIFFSGYGSWQPNALPQGP